jgi:hypothetical protein
MHAESTGEWDKGMIYSYDLLKTPGPALVRLCRAWTEEADDNEPLRRGVLYVIESLGGSLAEIAAEEGSESIRRDAEQLWQIEEDARKRWPEGEIRSPGGPLTRNPQTTSIQTKKDA